MFNQNNENQGYFISKITDSVATIIVSIIVAGAGLLGLLYFLSFAEKDNAGKKLKRKRSEDFSKVSDDILPITKPAVCLVVPAREFELTKSLDDISDNKSVDFQTWHFEQLKDKTQWFWYGSVESEEFRKLQSIVNNRKQESFNSALDFIVYLFELKQANRNFESGTIAGRYDGILELGGNVMKIKISRQISGDALNGLPLEKI